jgi:predicted nicotinamide N-methyase
MILGGIDDQKQDDGEKEDESIVTERLLHLNLDVQLRTRSHEASGRVSMAGTLWEASPVLAHYITNPACPIEGFERMRDSTNYAKKPSIVVELGSGIGLVSLAAALLGCQVCATDGSPSSIRLLEENFARYSNKFSVMPKASLLDWGNLSAANCLIQHELCGQYPDVIIASDVVYAHSAKFELKETIKHLCPKGHNGKAVIAHRWRAEPVEEMRFFESFDDEFDREEVGLEWFPDDNYYRTKSMIDFKYPVSIFQMSRKR